MIPDPPALDVESLEFTDLHKLRAWLLRKGYTHVRTAAGPCPVEAWRPYPGTPPALRLIYTPGMLYEAPDPFRPRSDALLGRWAIYKGAPPGRRRAPAGLRD